jgi:hypothetical protein
MTQFEGSGDGSGHGAREATADAATISRGSQNSRSGGRFAQPCNLGNVTEREDWRRDLAKEAFNRAWELIEKAPRKAWEDREMLVLAAASRFLWEDQGDEEPLLIGDWQIAHVLCQLGDGDLALQFAQAALERASDNGWQDWRLASCVEGMARAHAARGDKVARDFYAQRCQALIEALPVGEDRDLITSQLSSVPELA